MSLYTSIDILTRGAPFLCRRRRRASIRQSQSNGDRHGRLALDSVRCLDAAPSYPRFARFDGSSGWWRLDVAPVPVSRMRPLGAGAQPTNESIRTLCSSRSIALRFVGLVRSCHESGRAASHTGPMLGGGFVVARHFPIIPSGSQPTALNTADERCPHRLLTRLLLPQSGPLLKAYR